MSWLTFTGWYSRRDREGKGQGCGAAGLTAPAGKKHRESWSLAGAQLTLSLEFGLAL